MRTRTATALLLPIVLALAAVQARADLVIKITHGFSQPTPIAIVPFGSGGAGPIPVDVAQVISDDLERSGLFAPLPRAQMLAQPTQASQVNFVNWRALSVNDLVIGSVKMGATSAQVGFQLFNVYTQQQLLGEIVTAAPDNLRFAAHVVSDMIYQKLTGIRGAFATRIAYVQDQSAGHGRTNWELVVADADGANAQVVVKSPDLIMTPTWSPDGSEIAYVEFEGAGSAIYVQNVKTGQRRKVVSRAGNVSAPAFSPDGSKLAVVLSTTPGNQDIYILDLASGRLTQFTDNPAIDTEPAWLPSGQAIIFTSDRGGSPQLYEKPLGGGEAQRLTWQGNYNTDSAVSPDGRSVALMHRTKDGALTIAVLDLASDNLQVLTGGPLDGSPTYAPNGAMILYSTEAGGQQVLATVSVNSGVREELSGSSGALSQPSWGPFPPQPLVTPGGTGINY